MIRGSHAETPVAALDFDRTCLVGDVSEYLLRLIDERTGRGLVDEYEAQCRQDLRSAYVRLVSTLIGGRTEAEARGMALEALSIGERRGHLEIREPIRELVWALHRHGWDVWIVTASPEVLVQALAERMGIHPDRVVGMRSPLGGDGRYAPIVTDPITFREGKVEALRAAAGRDPVFAAGDSGSDAPLLGTARYALLLDHGDPELRAEGEARGWWIEPGGRIR
jgi:HAD superfamily phosphoserine phosphatase-like hydrolase